MLQVDISVCKFIFKQCLSLVFLFKWCQGHDSFVIKDLQPGQVCFTQPYFVFFLISYLSVDKLKEPPWARWRYGEAPDEASYRDSYVRISLFWCKRSSNLSLSCVVLLMVIKSLSMFLLNERTLSRRPFMGV